MKNKTVKFGMAALAAMISIVLMTGCSSRNRTDVQGAERTENASGMSRSASDMNSDRESAGVGREDSHQGGAGSSQGPSTEELTVRFGDEGDPFVMHLYDNDTAAAIARYVGTSDWRLPIYHYDDYENWEVMQYYDIPSRYDIPSNPEYITTEQAGTVYYSDPNRIVLFFQDAEVSGEYTPVGYFDYTEAFLRAVEDNPVLEGWGNKIINISEGAKDRQSEVLPVTAIGTAAVQTVPENSSEGVGDGMTNIRITAGGQEFMAKLYGNETTEELARRFPLTLNMSELNGNEKYYYLEESLPAEASRQPKIHSGDLMLYGTDCLVLFYENFSSSYSYTPVGYVEEPAGLFEALGAGNVTVTFETE